MNWFKPNDWLVVYHTQGVCKIFYPWDDWEDMICHFYIDYSKSRSKYRLRYNHESYAKSTGAYTEAINKLAEFNKTII